MNEENDNNAWNAHAGLYGESHKRLDNLETKTRLTQEIKAKRDELKRREMELIDHEQALRRQHDLLQKEREENQERQRQLEGERKNLQTKTKHLTREMEAMRKTVSRGEKEKFRAEDKLRQQILEKNQKIGLLERDMDLVRGRLEIADAKVKTASHTEAALRQTNSSIVVELKTAQHEQSKLHKQLERAREREAELEASLSKTREERDRADDRAARATRAADDASRQLATEKLRTAALEDDLRKMQEHTLMSARSGESRKLRLEDQSARGDGEDVTLASTTAIANARGPGRQEYLEMLAEVKRCLEEVQASKQANQVLEQRARRAEAELAALRSGSGDEGGKDFRKEMDGSSSLSLKESKALTKEAARLRSELEQREKTLTQAEWDRVAAEQEAEQVRSALQEAQSELESTLRQLKDVQQRAMESDEQLEVARDLEADLQQKLEEATFKLDEMEAQQEASREKAASHRADEERLLRDVIGEVTQYLGAAKRLTALLDAFLEGEQPTMDVLLDDVDGDTDAGARFAALSSSERIANLSSCTVTTTGNPILSENQTARLGFGNASLGPMAVIGPSTVAISSSGAVADDVAAGLSLARRVALVDMDHGLLVGLLRIDLTEDGPWSLVSSFAEQAGDDRADCKAHGEPDHCITHETTVNAQRANLAPHQRAKCRGTGDRVANRR
ncbi:Reticulocyte-binding protein 2-like a [Hondaea fermentalgiana]|uniref:Reticulocyte-binding protein 2-like a n=1 Tax=Hondaea fermentalgiana TaxID=2315210 RepID=A0A2R5GFW5_9STRA|nr:Reticulocyte-binding protein 2-like a [Hondaea fermentalgiana]|eukprot:GBG27533.1 Reticulocyte-binding protein 2-like a [Hondaea fermentalgiana]